MCTSLSSSSSTFSSEENRHEEEKKKNSRMKIACRSSLDRIGELPSSIAENILMFLPLQDAARTSILSKKWRYRWEKLPQLVFDHSFKPKSLKHPRDIVMKIYEILLFHQGPVFKFTLDINSLTSCFEIDKMIRFLSTNNIQDFTLCMSREEHTLPSYIFSCLELRHLFLRFCLFEPPPTFKGFSKLIRLELWEASLAPDVCISNFPLLETLKLQSTTIVHSFSIDAPRLKLFWFIAIIKYVSFINTPLVAILSIGSDEPFHEERTHTFNLIKVLGSLPLFEDLHLDFPAVKLLAVQKVPEKLPTMLNHLRYLELSGIDFTDLDELSCTLCLIRSSSNLQKLRITMCDDQTTNVEPVLEYLKMQDYSDVSLDKLREVELQCVSGLRPGLEFIKFLLATSPELEKMDIGPATGFFEMSCFEMLIELTRFRRASQKAEIIFPRLELAQA